MSFDKLQDELDTLIQELMNIHEFRRGSVTTGYPKCGKENCICKREGERGHETTTLTSKVAGKTKTRSIPSIAAVELVKQQIGRHKEFEQWCQRWKRVNEKICDLKLEEFLIQEHELGADIKKKRRRRSSRK
jgi:Family of unknown function (DUF6788)